MSRGLALHLSVLCVLGAFVAYGQLEERAPAQRSEPALAEDPIRGLWTRWPARHHEGDPVRFYYFHGDGHGLYRYGKVGLTNTHSFDYRASGDVLVLKFRKTGKEHRLRYAVEVGRDGRRLLRLKNDPEEDGLTTDYFFVPAPLADSTLHRASDARVGADARGPVPPGRMWIALTEYATGGVGFSLYQLAPAGIDGRGTGWHHKGDFDDWSTESLTYRLDASSMELRFELTGERFETRYGTARGDDGKNRLVLHEDPRNFWHRTVFTDMGRSFAIEALGPGLGALARGHAAARAAR